MVYFALRKHLECHKFGLLLLAKPYRTNPAPNMAEYRFRVEIEDHEAHRVLAIRAVSTFEELMHAGLKAFGFDTKHDAHLYLSDTYWRKSVHIGSTDEDYVERKRLKELRDMRLAASIADPHARFIVVYDLKGPRWAFQFELQDIGEATPDVPHVVKRVGDSPVQYPEERMPIIPAAGVAGAVGVAAAAITTDSIPGIKTDILDILKAGSSSEGNDDDDTMQAPLAGAKDDIPEAEALFAGLDDGVESGDLDLLDGEEGEDLPLDDDAEAEDDDLMGDFDGMGGDDAYDDNY